MIQYKRKDAVAKLILGIEDESKLIDSESFDGYEFFTSFGGGMGGGNRTYYGNILDETNLAFKIFDIINNERVTIYKHSIVNFSEKTFIRVINNYYNDNDQCQLFRIRKDQEYKFVFSSRSSGYTDPYLINITNIEIIKEEI